MRCVRICVLISMLSGWGNILSAQTMTGADLSDAVKLVEERITQTKNDSTIQLLSTMKRLLLTNRIDAADSNSGATSLMLACVLDDAELVNLLLRKNASVLPEDNGGRTALLLTTQYSRSLETVKALVERGSRLEARDDDLNGQTALMSAAYQGNEPVVRYLLDQGADVNARKTDGWSVLLIAIEGGSARVVSALLDKGADPNDSLPTPEGKVRALVLARQWYAEKRRVEYQQIADLLVSRGAMDPIPSWGVAVLVGGGGGLSNASTGDSAAFGTASMALQAFATLFQIDVAVGPDSTSLGGGLYIAIPFDLTTDGRFKLVPFAGGCLPANPLLNATLGWAAGASVEFYVDRRLFICPTVQYSSGFSLNQSSLEWETIQSYRGTLSIGYRLN